MINRKTLLSFFAFGIISLFLVAKSNFFFEPGDLSEDTIDRELEERAKGIGKNDFSGENLTAFGSDDYHTE